VRENVTARWQHYLVSLWRATIGMRMIVKRSSCYKMAAPLNTCSTIEQRGVVRFLWAKLWQQRISTKKCCPCTVNMACHVKQSSKTTSFEGTLSWRWCGGKSSVRVVPTATTRILSLRFPGTCEMVGQVFKFVWRLHCKKMLFISHYPHSFLFNHDL